MGDFGSGIFDASSEEIRSPSASGGAGIKDSSSELGYEGMREEFALAVMDLTWDTGSAGRTGRPPRTAGTEGIGDAGGDGGHKSASVSVKLYTQQPYLRNRHPQHGETYRYHWHHVF